MLRTLTTAVLAACLCTPAAAKEPFGPPCPTLTETRAAAQAMAEKEGAGIVAIDGKDAQAFLDIINKIGPPSDYRSEHIGLMLFVTKGAGMIVMGTGPCGGYQQVVIMPLAAVMKAYGEMRGGAPPPDARNSL